MKRKYDYSIDIKKNDILVWTNDDNIALDFFIASCDHVAHGTEFERPDSDYVVGCSKYGDIYDLHGDWCFDRKATEQEKEEFFRLLDIYNIYLNLNTFEIHKYHE